jgi:glycosyltransferase involved in cell wall biosynthesis
MRLGFDLLFLVPDESGGRETYTRELLSAIWTREPRLTATAFVNRETPAALAGDLGTVARVVRLPVSARRPEQWALGELGLLPVAARRAGIELLHSPANFGPASGRTRRVITLHDLQYRAVPELVPPVRRAGTAAMLGLAARRATRLITGAQAACDEIVRDFGVPAERIDVIPHGLGARRAPAPVPEAQLRTRHRLAERPVVVAVGTDLPHKNLGALLDALALIPPGQRPVLVLAGAGTDGPRLTAHAREAGVSDDVRLLGFAPGGELEGLYAIAAGAIMPTLYEGFGLPVLEAMDRGVPVACSDIPVLHEVAGDAALFFGPRRPQEIAGAIARLVADGDLRARLVDAGRRRAAQFSWDRAAQMTLATYRRALST